MAENPLVPGSAAPKPATAPPPAAAVKLRSANWAEHVKADAKPAKRFKVLAPSPLFRGERYGVQFVDGVGWTDNDVAAAACAELGYAWVDHSTQPPSCYWPGKPATADPTADDGTNAKT